MVLFIQRMCLLISSYEIMETKCQYLLTVPLQAHTVTDHSNSQCFWKRGWVSNQTLTTVNLANMI